MQQELTIWQKRFIRLAYEIATWSKDPDCTVGAVLVSPDRCSFSVGYNGFPRGLNDDATRLNNRDIKNLLTAHAELNALLNAHRDVRGWELYVTKAPCNRCASAVIQAGVSAVLTPAVSLDSNWSHSCLLAVSMFKEARIKIVNFDPESIQN